MGVCCCKSVPYEKPAQSFESLDHKVERASSISPSGSNTIQPMLEQKKLMRDGDNHRTQPISQMALCDERTSVLCTQSMNLIRTLSIYHSFIAKYSESNDKNNICDMISKRMNEYNIINLRNDYHHTITYHESNRKFMKSLFTKLMDLNDKNDVFDLQYITQKIDKDQEERKYFGHIMDDEITMIQTMNQIHYDVTDSYINNDNDDDDDASYDTANSVNEIDDDSVNEIDEDHMIKNKKNHKKGYTKSKTNDDEDDDVDEDMIGLRKRSKSKQKILDDDSWMDKKHKKKRKHIVSESIQMLGNTKLVSNNSFKQLQSLGALEENEFDLTKFNADNMDMDSDIDNEDI